MNKRKSPQTLPLIPMKSSTVWHGHSTRPSLPAGTVRKVNGSLLRGRRNRLILQPEKNRKFPVGELPCLTYHVWIFAGCVRQGAPCFFFVIYPMYQTAYFYGRNNSSLPCHDLTLSVGEPDNAAAQTGAGTSFGATGAPLYMSRIPLLIFAP